MNTQFDMTRFNTFVAENRIIRGKWNDEKEGREVACLLAAFAPNINSVADCPAGIMPGWLAHLTPNFDDEVTDTYWPDMVQEYAFVANRWHVLNEPQWRRVQLKTLDAALEIAELHDKANVVAPVRGLIARAISGDEPADTEWKQAAEAARAARAAAEAARAAAEAAAAAWAAWAAAWNKITKACLNAIKAGIEFPPQ